MMDPDDISPKMRNRYRPQDYFQLNVRNGVIRSPTGTRILSLPHDFIVGLHRGLEEETASAAPLILYQCGKWWGKQFARRHEAELRHFYSLDSSELHLHFYVQVLKRVWALYGWGSLSIDFTLRDTGFLEATVDSALFSEAVGNIGRTSDHVVSGVLASVVSEVSGRDLDCTEIACRSKGDKTCRFLIGIKSRTDVIEQWVKQGRSYQEVIESIESGDLV